MKEKTHSTEQKRGPKGENSSCQGCEKRENRCTTLKLRSKIQAKNVTVEWMG